MRWVALITAINAVVIAVFLVVANYLNGIPFSSSGLFFFTSIVVIIGLTFGLTLGLVGVLIARRIAPGSVWALLVIGASLGGLSGWLVNAPGKSDWLIGLMLGVLSAGQWWYFIERHPERRAYFD